MGHIVKFYVTPDPASSRVFSIDEKIDFSFIATREFGAEQYIYNGDYSIESLVEFVNKYKKAFITTITNSNSEEILGGELFVALLIKSPAVDYKKEQNFRKAAHVYYKQVSIPKIVFADIDRSQYERYISKTFDQAILVYIDPNIDLWFEPGVEVDLRKVNPILKSIDLLLTGKLKSRYMNGILGTFVKVLGGLIKPYYMFVNTHPILTIILMFLVIGSFVFYIVGSSDYQEVEIKQD